MKKVIITLLLTLKLSAGTVTCIDYGDMTVCTDNDTGEQTTIIKQ